MQETKQHSTPKKTASTSTTITTTNDQLHLLTSTTADQEQLIVASSQKQQQQQQPLTVTKQQSSTEAVQPFETTKSVSKQSCEQQQASSHQQQQQQLQEQEQPVIFRIETIFVMDENPFLQLRDKMTPLPGMIFEPSSGGKKFKKSKRKLSTGGKQPNLFLKNNSTAKESNEILNMAALGVGEQNAAARESSSRELQIKQRTNSSQFQTVSEFKKGKDLQSRKRSSDIPGCCGSQGVAAVDTAETPITTTSGQQVVKSPTKNLLAEFEKDETLEPDSSIFTNNNSSSKQQVTSISTAAAASAAAGQEVDGGERESGFAGRQERREQAARKPKQDFRQKNKNNFKKDESEYLPPQINLQNVRDQKVSDNDNTTQRHQEKDFEKSNNNMTPTVKKQSLAMENLTLSRQISTPQKMNMQQLDEGKRSPRRKHLISKFAANDFFQGQPDLKTRFTELVRKFNLELMKSTCQVMKGCKSWKAKQIAESVFELLNEILTSLYEKSARSQIHQKESISSDKDNAKKLRKTPQKSSMAETSSVMDTDQPQPVQVVRQITTSVSKLKDILNYCFQMNNYQKPDCLKDFLVASLLMQSKINVIVLLAGTSGTGKSTLASLLGTRLGISTVLSTDSVRHVMRNFLKEENNPTLFCSTYEAGNTVSEEERQNASENWITLKGYKKQCSLVTKELAKVIESFYNRNESLVVEGVHLTMSFLKEMMSKYPTCIPFVLYIKNKNKHGERFAVRAKHMTIDPRFNKYISNIAHIRTIQEYLLKKSEEILIPRIENHNVDRSVSLIQATIMKCLHRISEGAAIYDVQSKRATGIHKAVQSIQKHQLSSKQAQSVIHMKVDRVKMVENFLENQTNKADYDPDFERKLKSHRLSASYEARAVNIWTCGEFATEHHNDEEDEFDSFGKQKRSISIVNVMPELDPEIENLGAPGRSNYYQLSKAEKKRIKKDLLEFAKRKQGLTKENEIRQNLIKTEEALEAKINEGSEASSILNDHRKNAKKVMPKVDEQQLTHEKLQQLPLETAETFNQPAAESNNSSYSKNIIIDPLAAQQQQPPIPGQPSSQSQVQNQTAAVNLPASAQQDTVVVNGCSSQPSAATTEMTTTAAQVADAPQDDDQKKLIAKKLLSDKQKQNELQLLKEAQLRAEKTIQKEESQQMQQQIKESAKQKKKRNKSQELTGVMDPDAGNAAAGNNKSDGVNSYGSIEALVDEEEDAQRLREVQEVEQMQLALQLKNENKNQQQQQQQLLQQDKQVSKKPSNKRLFEAQKKQLESVQQVNLSRVQDAGGEQEQQANKPIKNKFEYKDLNQAGSADNLIRAAAEQESKPLTKSKFAPLDKRTNNHHHNNQAENQDGTSNSNPNLSEQKAEKGDNNKLQFTSSHGKTTRFKHGQSSQKDSEQIGNNQPEEETKKVHSRRERARHQRPQNVQRSVTTGGSNYAVNSTHGDAHSLSDKNQVEMAASSTDQSDGGHHESNQGHHHHYNHHHHHHHTGRHDKVAIAVRPSATQASQEDGHSGFGEINKTIEEEDSEYSQTIGSLVSYTINYMEKNTVHGGRHDYDVDRIREVDHSDSDEDDDHSMLAEKEEDSHSDIDTIEEEVDLSSEGSDHEEQQEEIKETNNNNTQMSITPAAQLQSQADDGATTTQLTQQQDVLQKKNSQMSAGVQVLDSSEGMDKSSSK